MCHKERRTEVKRFALVVLITLSICVVPDAQTLRDLVGVTINARIVSVVDGDTVDMVPDGESRAVRVRLEGVDAPERSEPFNQQARTFTRVLLFDQTVRATGRDVDRYGRLVARLNVAGKDASVEITYAGLACHYTVYSSDPLLARAETEARSAGRGFWAVGAQRPACATRERARPSAPASGGTGAVAKAGFRGNTKSHVYHASWCPNFTCSNCTRLFTTEADAQAAGFRPAGDCLRK
jgi:endonuclease YncB( thermonuclease family)